jgi:hypothetical protein
LTTVEMVRPGLARVAMGMACQFGQYHGHSLVVNA